MHRRLLHLSSSIQVSIASKSAMVSPAARTQSAAGRGEGTLKHLQQSENRV